MDTTHKQQTTRPALWGVDRSLLLLIGGVVVLILAGLIAVPLLSRMRPSLAPESAPEGVVQRFYLAAFDGDWDTAHSYLSAEARRKLTVAELQEQMHYALENSQVRTGAATVRDGSATVDVTYTQFYDGGLFGSGGEYSREEEVLLTREGDAWKIASGPFSLPDK